MYCAAMPALRQKWKGKSIFPSSTTLGDIGTMVVDLCGCRMKDKQKAEFIHKLHQTKYNR